MNGVYKKYMSEVKQGLLSAGEQNQRAKEEAIKLMGNIKLMEKNGSPGLVLGSESKIEMDESIPEDDRLFRLDQALDWQNPELPNEYRIKFQALSVVHHNLGLQVLNVRPYSIIGARKEPGKTGERENVRPVTWLLQSPTHPNIWLITTDTATGNNRRQLQRGLYYIVVPKPPRLSQREL